MVPSPTLPKPLGSNPKVVYQASSLLEQQKPFELLDIGRLTATFPQPDAPILVGDQGATIPPQPCSNNDVTVEGVTMGSCDIRSNLNERGR